MPQTKNNKERLSEKAYRLIKERIIALGLRPGSQVDEATMAAELSIGRTPVREAILRLGAENLLEAVPGKGYFVRSVGLEDIRALFEAMLINERAVVVLAARRIGPGSLAALAETNQALKAAMADKDFLGVTLLNSSLHRLIYLAAQNEFLYSALDHMQNQAQRLAYLCFSKEAGPFDLDQHNDRVTAHHEELIELLEKRDEEGLLKTITAHIQLFHDRVAGYTSPSARGLELLLPQGPPNPVDGSGSGG